LAVNLFETANDNNHGFSTISVCFLCVVLFVYIEEAREGVRDTVRRSSIHSFKTNHGVLISETNIDDPIIANARPSVVCLLSIVGTHVFTVDTFGGACMQQNNCYCFLSFFFSFSKSSYHPGHHRARGWVLGNCFHRGAAGVSPESSSKRARYRCRPPIRSTPAGRIPSAFPPPQRP